MSASRLLKYGWRLSGLIVLFVSVIYVFQAISSSFNSATVEQLMGQISMVVILVALLVYLVSLLAQSDGWTQLIISNEGGAYSNAFRFHSVTQLFRYLPGNLAHYLARQTFAHRSGLKQKRMFELSLWELISQFAAAGTLFVFGFFVFQAPLPDALEFGELLQSPFMLLVLVAVACCMAVFFSKQVNVLSSDELRGNAYGLVRVYLASLIYFVLNGLVLVVIYQFWSNTGFDWQSLITIVSGYSIAWMLGVITPLAPAGVGVREAALLVLLEHLSTDGLITFVVIAHRLIQLIGDMLYAALVWLLVREETIIE